MRDLSMHILDLAENCTRAGARNVSIEIIEDGTKGLMTITIKDDGKGMTLEEVRNALDPFYTTKGVRKVGLGLPMMRETAERCEGGLEVESKPGVGTTIRATMLLNHIDRPPMGDLTETLTTLISGHPEVDFDVRYVVDGEVEEFSTRGGRPEGDGTPANAAEVK
jgi:anti-sigma regulatory factor (Ser/Thr protein kinase)